jgi:alcohol dehydrogenase (NADP+)
MLTAATESAEGKMKWEEYTPKSFTDDDVDIKISHCGICGSDLHTLRSGWYPTPYPCVVGHEIIGKAVKVGKNVKHVKEGDRVGVGAQAASCLKPDCAQCSDGFENHCPQMGATYGAFFPGDKKEKTYGGYANYNRTPGHFVFKIPDNIESEHAAPIMCGGITLYSPLKTYNATGKNVGIVGLGGLGHFGVLFAKALGAKSVTVISRSHAKEEDAKALGADNFIATGDEGWESGKNASSLDLIVSTVSSDKMPLPGYLNLLKFRGTFVQVGAPEDPLPAFQAFALIQLNLVSEKNIKPWTQSVPLKEANQAVIDFEAGKPRFRFVLKNENYTD